MTDIDAEYIVNQIEKLIEEKIRKHFSASDRQDREHQQTINEIKDILSDELKSIINTTS